MLVNDGSERMGKTSHNAQLVSFILFMLFVDYGMVQFWEVIRMLYSVTLLILEKENLNMLSKIIVLRCCNDPMIIDSVL